MSYPQALDYLNSFVNYERSNLYPYRSCFKLERIRRLLQSLGNPQEGLRIIHIAGSKGKGSTCAFLAHILSEAGFKVGLYTSPHLVDLRERIRILQLRIDSKQLIEKEKISKKGFSGIIERIRPYTEKLRETKLGTLSYYEILTALGFLYFKEKKCDFVVLETGIGGRVDATNVACSLVSAITPISHEHTQVLGKTLAKIAAEKAAIIKHRTQI
ncbi:MAG: Mur ligase family protein, partial [Omnitrophica bacterium]|nr:Mur ligase family protein [Candidatus Omnitrophota bacterium]